MNNITPTREDYIKAILTLRQKGKPARIKDIADTTGVSKPSVVSALKSLTKQGFVIHEHYGTVDLTDKGKAIARYFQERHTVIFNFLHKILGIEANQADQEACRLEHYLSEKSIARLQSLNDFLNNLPADRHIEMDKMLGKVNNSSRKK